MNGAKPVNSPVQPASPLADAGNAAVGPGLGSLLQGQRNGLAAAPPARDDSLTPRIKRLRWTLVAADIVLLLLPGWLVFGQGRVLGLWDTLLCVLAVSLAAALGCWAFLLSAGK